MLIPELFNYLNQTFQQKKEKDKKGNALHPFGPDIGTI
jgi:hypothetical protein